MAVDPEKLSKEDLKLHFSDSIASFHTKAREVLRLAGEFRRRGEELPDDIQDQVKIVSGLFPDLARQFGFPVVDDDTTRDGTEQTVTLIGGPVNGTTVPQNTFTDGLYVGPGPYYPHYRVKEGSVPRIAEFEGYGR